jgi:hypothetical protein
MIVVLNLQRFVWANSPVYVEMIGDNFLRRPVVLKNFSEKISTKKPALSFQKADFYHSRNTLSLFHLTGY